MFWQIWGAFYVVGCEGLFVCFEHKSESKSLDVSGPKTICFSDETSLPLWRSFGKKTQSGTQKCFEGQAESTKQMEYAVHIWTD